MFELRLEIFFKDTELIDEDNDEDNVEREVDNSPSVSGITWRSS